MAIFRFPCMTNQEFKTRWELEKEWDKEQEEKRKKAFGEITEEDKAEELTNVKIAKPAVCVGDRER